MTKISFDVCANPECEKPFIEEESERFILEIELPKNIKEDALTVTTCLCVDCCMLRLEELHDIRFVRTLVMTTTEEIRAYTKEEFEEYEKRKNEENEKTDGA